MTVGQKEKITYRGKLVRTARSNPFLKPSLGIGVGLGETGIALNRVLNAERASPQRRIVREVTGTVVEETAVNVTLELPSGRRMKIRLTDIVRRQILQA